MSCKPVVSKKGKTCCDSTCGCTPEDINNILSPPTSEGSFVLSYNTVTNEFVWITSGTDVSCSSIRACVDQEYVRSQISELYLRNSANSPWIDMPASDINATNFDTVNTKIRYRTEDFGRTLRLCCSALTNGGSKAISGLILCILPPGFRPNGTSPFNKSSSIVGITGGNVPTALVQIFQNGVVSFKDLATQTGQMTNTEFEITFAIAT